MLLRTCFLSLITAAGAAAADSYVSPSGNDANPGTISAPFRTVQHAVNVVSAGGHIWLRDGTYREGVAIAKAGTASAPIVISAYGSEHPVIKGSQLVTGWVRYSGNIWKRTGWTVDSQQLFADNLPLAQCGIPAVYGNNSSVDGTKYFQSYLPNGIPTAAGRFWMDNANHVLYAWLADSGDPNAHSMEASVQAHALSMPSSAYVQVKGVAFRHSNVTTAGRIMGGLVELGDHSTLDGCDIQYGDFAGVVLGYQKSDDQILNCVISHNGDSGINGSVSTNYVIRGDDIAANNYRGFNFMWHAGGLKMVTKGSGTVDHNRIHDNQGNGLWFDYADSGAACVAYSNTIANNTGDAGIMVEGSKAITLKNNLVTGNGRRGIYISASDSVVVANNTVCGNTGVSALCLAGMPRSGKTLSNIQVYGNILFDNTATNDLFILKENGTDIYNLRADYNCVWRSNGAIANWYGLDSRGGWAGATYTSLSAWRNATPYDDHGKQADPLFTSGTWQPRSGSPAIDAGVAVSGVTIDFNGVARPQGGACDMGAYEYIGSSTPPPTPTPTPTPTGFSAKINFQPAGASTPSGYLADTGAAFGARNGQNYGWNAATETRERNKTSDQLRDTLALMQAASNPNAKWEIAVPNGTYTVHVVCGDPSYFDGNIKLDVEGKRAVDAVATSSAPFPEGTVTVNVADGRLTLSTESGTYNTKICCVEISSGTAPAPTPTPTPKFAAKVNFQPSTSAAVSGYLVDAGAAFAARNGQSYGWNAPVEMRERNQTSDQLRDTLALMQAPSNPSAKWEIAVPNGTYSVHMVCGDPSYFDGNIKLDVEGKRAIDALATSAAPFPEGTVTVTVGDGRLTLSTESGSYNTKICFVELQQQ